MTYCPRKENGRQRPRAAFGSQPVVYASTVPIRPANTGFGGCVPPAGVSPANASSINAPTFSPKVISPKISPVSVDTISGRKIKNASRKKSRPTIIVIMVSRIPCKSVISILLSSPFQFLLFNSGFRISRYILCIHIDAL